MNEYLFIYLLSNSLFIYISKRFTLLNKDSFLFFTFFIFFLAEKVEKSKLSSATLKYKNFCFKKSHVFRLEKRCCHNNNCHYLECSCKQTFAVSVGLQQTSAQLKVTNNICICIREINRWCFTSHVGITFYSNS